jgi:glycosyltransferase involved in cell wall biosynthesis
MSNRELFPWRDHRQAEPVDLSVVVPCINNAGVIGEQLDALAEQRWHRPWEVVVVDNGSTDDTVAVVEQHSACLPHLQVLRAPEKRSAAHARNVGVAAACGRAIAFCDADDRVGDGWLSAMGNALDQYPFVAARLDIAALNPPQIVQSVNNPQAQGLQQVEYPPHFCHASGATLGVRREAHEVVGGFDEDLPYLEDTDYCLRLQRSGFPLEFLPDAVIHYRFKDRPQAMFQQARHWGEYNVLMYKRYGGDTRLERPWRRHLSRWRALLRRVPALLTKDQRLNWMKTLGTQVGTLEGAIKYRVPPIAMWAACALAKAERIDPAHAFFQ